ncbi:hypothetical protein ABZ319_10640 [Nocardia sp. NPDC005978]|uniref:hypothetical protein n=1 Tax=Nocardia sp. NPDC005978 TaxID=3156725 RepID=UPI0033A3EADB
MTNSQGTGPISNPVTPNPSGSSGQLGTQALPHRTGTAYSIAGGLLLAAAALFAGACFTTLARSESRYGSVEWQAWHYIDQSAHYTQSHIRWVGVALAVGALSSLLAGAMLVAGLGDRSPVARWFGCLTAGFGLGVTWTMLLDIASYRGTTGGPGDIDFGVGFVFLVVAAILTLGALAAAGLGMATVPELPSVSGRPSGGSAFGALLLLFAVTIVTAAFQPLTGEGASLLIDKSTGTPQLLGLPLLLAAGAAVVSAVILFAAQSGRGRKLARVIGICSAGVCLGGDLTVMLSQVLESHGLGLLDQPVGGWLLTAALPLTMAAIALGLTAGPTTGVRGPSTQPVHRNSLPPPPVHSRGQGHPPKAKRIRRTRRPLDPFRIAKVHDGRDSSGKPIIEREPLSPQLQATLLLYLESAPLIWVARGFDEDAFAPDALDVPLGFRTDGTWIWAEAIAHYLRKYKVPPDPEMVRHIMARGFRLEGVDETTKQRAAWFVSGQ